MEIYNVIVKDRHCDTFAVPFLNKEDAIKHAKAIVEKYNTYKEDIEERQIDGWLYHCQYSSEGCSVWVTEHDTDKPPEI